MPDNDFIPQRKCVECHDFESAEDLLRFLRPESGHWGSGHQVEWLFRGQRDARWDLVPSAWRRTTFNWYKPIFERALPRPAEPPWRNGSLDDICKALFPEHPPATESVGQNEWGHVQLVLRAAEREAVRQFAVLADETGHYVPDHLDWIDRGSIADRSESEWWSQLSDRRWPDVVADEFHAYAQHHGVPTSLLDWTAQSTFAAWFACEGVTPQQSASRLAVWAVNLKTASSLGFDVASCRRHEHKFLQVQQGYLLHLMCCGNSEPRRLRSLTELVDAKHRAECSPAFRRVTIPVSEANRLVQLLVRERITRARLYPSYDAVGQSLKALWSHGIGDWPPHRGVLQVEQSD